MYHLSTQYREWLFTAEQLKERRTKANADYVRDHVREPSYVGELAMAIDLLR